MKLSHNWVGNDIMSNICTDPWCRYAALMQDSDTPITAEIKHNKVIMLARL
jgi:hypothetical protein